MDLFYSNKNTLLILINRTTFLKAVYFWKESYLDCNYPIKLRIQKIPKSQVPRPLYNSFWNLELKILNLRLNECGNLSRFVHCLLPCFNNQAGTGFMCKCCIEVI
jgi:hypothetical protein